MKSDALLLKFLLEIRLMEGVRGLLVDDDVVRQGRNGRVDVPAWRAVLGRLAGAAVVSDIGPGSGVVAVNLMRDKLRICRRDGRWAVDRTEPLSDLADIQLMRPALNAVTRPGRDRVPADHLVAPHVPG